MKLDYKRSTSISFPGVFCFVKQPSGHGLCCMEGTMGAYFDATVAADTSVIIKINACIIPINCLYRTKLPAFPTQFTPPIVGDGSLDHVLSHKSVEPSWPKDKRPHGGKDKIFNLLKIPAVRHRITHQFQFFSQRHHLRAQL